MKPVVKLTSIYEFIRSHSLFAIQAIAGLLIALSISLVILLSTPVFIFRFVVIRLAKYLRPDLGQPLNPLSVGMVGDLYSSTKPPRANVIFPLTFDGNFELTQFEKLVLTRWIEARTNQGDLCYPQFSQFPVPLLGFMFWKTDINFDIKNHIHLHRNKSGAADKELNQLTEHLLNAPLNPHRSPWELHIFQNYRNPKLHDDNMSVVFFKLHHSLTDGYGIMDALANGLLGHDQFQLPIVKSPKRSMSMWRMPVDIFLTSINGSAELARVLWEMLRDNPWKIPDDEKAWHQLFAKSELIPIQKVKQIKDKFGVTFTSVFISAISSAIHNNLEWKRVNGKLRVENQADSMQFLYVLPRPTEDRSERLTNNLTGSVFNIPTGRHNNSIERLLACNGTLEGTKNSVIPAFSSTYITCFGSHFRWVLPYLMKWQTIATGVSNFPSLGNDYEWGMLGRKLLLTETVSGAQEGAAGVTFMVVSSFGHVRVAVAAEKGLLSRSEVEELVKSVENEIDKLHSLSK